MKYKIVALFGPAGSGKDYLQKEIMKTQYGKENLNEIISYTTRPPREGEIDGVHYHFVSYFGFDLDKMVEYSSFRNWWYGTSTDSLQLGKINIGVFNPEGINTLLENKIVSVQPVYVKADDKVRMLRQLNREDNPDCLEICRRFETDRRDFENIKFPYIEFNNNPDSREEGAAAASLEQLISNITWVN